MILTTPLVEQLELANLKIERFREIVHRLFAYGIILRDEGDVEQRLYDDARRIDNVLTEYFALAGFRLHHELKSDFFRLYAPGAQVPGLPDDNLEPVPSLRARITPDFVAAALALRFMYQQGLMEGDKRLTDEGEVLIRFEELAATLQTQLKRPLPDSVVERDRLLKELKRHRLIHFAPTFSMSDEDAFIAIRQVILGIISEDSLASALENGEIVEQTEEAVEEVSE